MTQKRECTIRVFKLLPFDKQEISVACPGHLEYKTEDISHEYVRMIEHSAYMKAVEALTTLTTEEFYWVYEPHRDENNKEHPGLMKKIYDIREFAKTALLSLGEITSEGDG